MSSLIVSKPEYGNWVSERIIYLLGFVSFVLFGLALLFWILLVPAVLFLLASAYFLYVTY